MSTLIAAIRSAVTYVVVSIYVLLAGLLGMAVAVPLKWVGLLYDLGHIGVGLALGLAGIRYHVSGRERIPKGRAMVFCSNHQSNVDPPVLFRALHRRLHILYKAELSKLPVFGTVIQVGGFIPVPREQKEAAMEAIDKAADSIRSGNSFLIFPEGTRSRTDQLLPFKKGGFIMSIKAQAPIVPVAISGGRDAMRKGSAIIRPVRVEVRIGEPVETAGYTLDERDALIQVVRERIEALLRQDQEPGAMSQKPGARR
ncbi:MAG TPA: lysophospholipid acyltransferase family protein [Vicinamibacterales bacterium]|nr:lysophospholipid acyltransferase family protein [Vicinamibacterales bacterium]